MVLRYRNDRSPCGADLAGPITENRPPGGLFGASCERRARTPWAPGCAIALRLTTRCCAPSPSGLPDCIDTGSGTAARAGFVIARAAYAATASRGLGNQVDHLAIWSNATPSPLNGSDTPRATATSPASITSSVRLFRRPGGRPAPRRAPPWLIFIFVANLVQRPP